LSTTNILRMASAAFNWLFRRAPKAPVQVPEYAWNIHTNPYQCKRTWPPEFSKLSNTHQFSLERRYRRRTKLKFARPVWTRFTKLVQWGMITGFVFYGVLYMEVDERLISPFQPVRSFGLRLVTEALL
jgi:hypothetical protein